MNVATMTEVSRQWTVVKLRAMRMILPIEGSAYASDHARDVRKRKKRRRYGKAGSWEEYVFLVCFWWV